ncbi:MAG TPA: metallopeptidase TldD-related protein [Trueperaceae bacterium]
MTFEEAKRWLLDKAAQRGVDAEVLANTERELAINARDGKAEETTVSQRGGMGLRVVDGGRVGYSSTEDLREESLGWALDEAIDNASLQASGGAALPSGGSLGRHDLLDEGLSGTVDEKLGMALALEDSLKGDPRVQSVQYSLYTESLYETHIGSTKGVDGSYRRGTAAMVAGLVMREGPSVKQGFKIDAANDFHQLEPGRTGQMALEKIGRQLGARGLTTGRRRAIFEPEVVATLLQLLVYALSGKSLAEGKSGLQGKLGERVATDAFTLVDDATLPHGLASRPFDSEGTPSRRLVLIEEGVLRSFLHNTDTAARTGQETTGHARRGYAETLGVGISNLILESGSGVTVGDGILVTDLMGVHAGANPVTGDVSVQAMGLETVGGETFPVDDFAVSFNLFELLKRIEEVGDDPVTRPTMGDQGAVTAPSIAVPDVSFAGK